MLLDVVAAHRHAVEPVVAGKVNREVAVLLGWAPAILLQLAHPLVATGVAEHSSVRRAPGTRVRRLRSTLGAMLALTFGTPEEVGEQVTLKRVAQHADMCNLLARYVPTPEHAAQKLGVLRAHCDALGRDYDAIVKSHSFNPILLAPDAARPGEGGLLPRATARRPGAERDDPAPARRPLPRDGDGRHRLLRAVPAPLGRLRDARAAGARGHARAGSGGTRPLREIPGVRVGQGVC